MNLTQDEAPLWIREFDTGLAEGWREDDLLLYAQCQICERAVYASNMPGTLEWIHYNPPQFHKPQFPTPCFTPEPRPDTVIGQQRTELQEPQGIFQQKTDKAPESAEMLLFMLSAQDRFLFGEMYKQHRENLTSGEDSLCRRMLLSMKAQHVITEANESAEGEAMSEDSPYGPDPEGTREKTEAAKRREPYQPEPKNPEGVIKPAKKPGKK